MWLHEPCFITLVLSSQVGYILGFMNLPFIVSLWLCLWLDYHLDYGHSYCWKLSCRPIPCPRLNSCKCQLSSTKGFFLYIVFILWADFLLILVHSLLCPFSDPKVTYEFSSSPWLSYLTSQWCMPKVISPIASRTTTMVHSYEMIFGHCSLVKCFVEWEYSWQLVNLITILLVSIIGKLYLLIVLDTPVPYVNVQGKSWNPCKSM